MFVTIGVDSKPSGASVWVFEKEQGKTPFQLRVEKGSKPIDVAIRLADHTEAVERVTPDVNQRLRVSLSKADSKRGSSRVTVSRPKGKGGFRRFD